MEGGVGAVGVRVGDSKGEGGRTGEAELRVDGSLGEFHNQPIVGFRD